MSHVATSLPVATARFTKSSFADRVRLAQPAARAAILQALAGAASDDSVGDWVRQAFGIDLPDAVSGLEGDPADALYLEVHAFIDAAFALGVAAGLNVRPELFDR